MKTTKIKRGITLENVTRIERRGIGPVYRAVAPLSTVAEMLHQSNLLYAPRYQRGFKLGSDDIPEEMYKQPPVPIHTKDLQIDARRAHEMAVKYLQGKLFSVNLTWNARKKRPAAGPPLERVATIPDGNHRHSGAFLGGGDGGAVYDEDAGELQLDTLLTIPDTAHRHMAYYLLWLWKTEQKDVPAVVQVNRRDVSRDDILDLLEVFEPDNEYVFVDVYHLSEMEEGLLYDEFNSDGKPPATAVAIDLNPEKTPSRRFVYMLMSRSDIFCRDEIECRRNTIGSKSRKLTTNATLEAAVRPFERDLAELEKAPAAYEDLIAFVDRFFEAWADYYPAFQPNASAEARKDFRVKSLALSNVIFHPLIRMVYELWLEYRRLGVDWGAEMEWPEGAPDWRAAIEALGGKVTTRALDEQGRPKPDADNNPQLIEVDILSRDNPDWVGKVLIVSNEGSTVVKTLSNTRQTREAAYQYLCARAGVKLTGRAGRKAHG
jgi:hypothetical protein